MVDFQRPKAPKQPLRDDLNVRLLLADCVVLDSRWNAQGMRSSYWRLYVNSAPGAFVTVSGKRYPIEPMQIHLIPAWVRFDCRNDATLMHLYIHFDVVGWPPSMIRDVFPKPIRLPPKTIHVGLYDLLLNQLHDGKHGSTETLSFAKAMVYLSLGEIIHEHIRENRWNHFLCNSTELTAAFRYIEEHLAEPIHNMNLAKLCFMSESHFIRRFRALLGQPPGQYVRERRVARAAEELAMTANKLEDIARNCGFANRYYLTRVFTAVMGIPPARYRTRAIVTA